MLKFMYPNVYANTGPRMQIVYFNLFEMPWKYSKISVNAKSPDLIST